MSEFKEIEYPHNKPVKLGTYRITFEVLDPWDMDLVISAIEGEMGSAVDKIEIKE